MSRFLAAAALAVLLAGGASAQEASAPEPKAWPVKLGTRFTGGSGGYRNYGGYAQVGSEWKLRAGYSGYTFDGSTNPVHTGSLRAGYQGEHLGLGVSASFSPLEQDYRNRSWGTEGSWAFTPGEEDADAWLEELEFNAWWTQTRHHQTVPDTAAVRTTRREIIINQHDLGLGASATAGPLTLSMDGYVVLYDQDNFGAILALSRNRPRLSATVSLVNGFPRNGTNVRLDYEAARWLVPYVSVSRTEYQVLVQPVSTSYGGGAALRYGPVGFEAGYERAHQAGADDTSYLTLGASVRF